ncbi:MAG: hypothetical protein IJN29_01990 [Akkermansia sp.]|nr:hypothetical protein [Akkermansia sp.]
MSLFVLLWRRCWLRLRLSGRLCLLLGCFRLRRFWLLRFLRLIYCLGWLRGLWQWGFLW